MTKKAFWAGFAIIATAAVTAVPTVATAQVIVRSGRHTVVVSDRWRGWHSRAEMFAHRHWDRRHRIWIYQYPSGYWKRHPRH